MIYNLHKHIHTEINTGTEIYFSMQCTGWDPGTDFIHYTVDGEIETTKNEAHPVVQ